MQRREALVITCLLALAQASDVAKAAPATTPSVAHRNFIQHCSGCHSPDGSGSPAMGIPSMRGTLGLFLQIPGGREFIVQVPGVMNSPLNDRDIADLMNWLLPYTSQQSLPKDTSPYSAEEIARLRRSRPTDIPAARREVILRARSAGLDVDALDAPVAATSGAQAH